MALSALKNNFVSRAAAVGLAATAAVTPLSSSFAEDAAGSRNPAITRTAHTTLTPEQVARLEVEAAAFDYAKAHPGHIAISVLKGPDAGSRSGQEIAGLFERGMEKRYNVEIVGYAGDNGRKPTEVTFHYLMVDTDNRPLVYSAGPYNVGDAMARIPDVVRGAKAPRQLAALSYSPSND